MKNVNFLYLSMEDIIAAGGLNMKLAIEDVECALSLFNKKDCRLPDKVVLRWGETKEDELLLGR